MVRESCCTAPPQWHGGFKTTTTAPRGRATLYSRIQNSSRPMQQTYGSIIQDTDVCFPLLCTSQLFASVVANNTPIALGITRETGLDTVVHQPSMSRYDGVCSSADQSYNNFRTTRPFNHRHRACRTWYNTLPPTSRACVTKKKKHSALCVARHRAKPGLHAKPGRVRWAASSIGGLGKWPNDFAPQKTNALSPAHEGREPQQRADQPPHRH